MLAQTIETMKRVRKRITNKKRWTQNASFRTKSGKRLEYEEFAFFVGKHPPLKDLYACCLSGAIVLETGGKARSNVKKDTAYKVYLNINQRLNVFVGFGEDGRNTSDVENKKAYPTETKGYIHFNDHHEHEEVLNLVDRFILYLESL